VVASGLVLAGCGVGRDGISRYLPGGRRSLPSCVQPFEPDETERERDGDGYRPLRGDGARSLGYDLRGAPRADPLRRYGSMDYERIVNVESRRILALGAP